MDENDTKASQSLNVSHIDHAHVSGSRMVDNIIAILPLFLMVNLPTSWCDMRNTIKTEKIQFPRGHAPWPAVRVFEPGDQKEVTVIIVIVMVFVFVFVIVIVFVFVIVIVFVFVIVIVIVIVIFIVIVVVIVVVIVIVIDKVTICLRFRTFAYNEGFGCPFALWTNCPGEELCTSASRAFPDVFSWH